MPAHSFWLASTPLTPHLLLARARPHPCNPSHQLSPLIDSPFFHHLPPSPRHSLFSPCPTLLTIDLLARLFLTKQTLLLQCLKSLNLCLLLLFYLLILIGIHRPHRHTHHHYPQNIILLNLRTESTRHTSSFFARIIAFDAKDPNPLLSNLPKSTTPPIARSFLL